MWKIELVGTKGSPVDSLYIWHGVSVSELSSGARRCINMELVFVQVLFLPLLNWEITLIEKKDGKLTKVIISSWGVLVNPHFLYVPHLNCLIYTWVL